MGPEGDHLWCFWPSSTYRVSVPLLTMLCDKCTEGCQPGSSLKFLVFRVFIGAQSQTVCLADLSSPTSPGSQTDAFNLQFLWRSQLKQYGPKPPSYIMLLDCPWPRSWETKMLLSSRIFQRPRDHLPETKGKAWTSLWVRLILHYTDVHFSKGCISSLVAQN